jgi:hypothetical protein
MGEKDGRIYDKDCQLKGRVGEDGRIYYETWRLKGRVTPDGRVFNEEMKGIFTLL